MEKHGGSWVHALDLVAHCQSIAMVVSWFVATVMGIYRRFVTRSRISSVRPAMDSAVVEEIMMPCIVNVSEQEQFEAYEALRVRLYFTDDTEITSDKIIEAAVKQWRKMERHQNKCTDETAVLLSEACRGHVTPALCSRVLYGVVRRDKYVLRIHEKRIIKRLSLTYLKMHRLLEETQFHRDVMYGPVDGNGISAFRLSLGL